jgi:hypothetical protein
MGGGRRGGSEAAGEITSFAGMTSDIAVSRSTGGLSAGDYPYA